LNRKAQIIPLARRHKKVRKNLNIRRVGMVSRLNAILESKNMEPVEIEAAERPLEGARGFFATVFDALRMITILATMALVIAGAVLAYDVFFFVKEIIAQPQMTVRMWQDTVVPVQEAESASTHTPPPAAAPALTPEAATPTEAAPLVTPAQPAQADAAPEPVPALPTEAPVAAESPAAPAVPVQFSPSPRPVQTDPWLDLAEQLLQMLETGNLSWLAGMALSCTVLLDPGKDSGAHDHDGHPDTRRPVPRRSSARLSTGAFGFATPKRLGGGRLILRAVMNYTAHRQWLGHGALAAPETWLR
jgi:hypothetical protein